MSENFEYPHAYRLGDSSYVFTHWTNKGVIKIKPMSLGGGNMLEVSWNGVFLFHTIFYDAALKNLFSDEFESQIGFKASGNIPRSLYEWNGLE